MTSTDLPESTVDYIRALLAKWTGDSTDRAVAKVVGLSAQAVGNIARRGAPITPQFERTIARILNIEITPLEAMAATEMARPASKRRFPAMPDTVDSADAVSVDRTDSDEIPHDDTPGVDIEAILRALSAEHADPKGGWTDAEAERVRLLVRRNPRQLRPHDLREFARSALRAVRKCGVGESDAGIALFMATGSTEPPKK